jgi:hypothetical protein
MIRIGVALAGVVAGLAAAAPAAGVPGARPGPGGAAGAAAVAGDLDGRCDPGDLCLWHGVFEGSVADFSYIDGDLNDNVFPGPGAGQNTFVANNSESAHNYDSSWTAFLCTGTNGRGTCVVVRPNQSVLLTGDMLDNVESILWSI